VRHAFTCGSDNSRAPLLRYSQAHASNFYAFSCHLLRAGLRCYMSVTGLQEETAGLPHAVTGYRMTLPIITGKADNDVKLMKKDVKRRKKT